MQSTITTTTTTTTIPPFACPVEREACFIGDRESPLAVIPRLDRGIQEIVG